jgi:urease accessory protein
MKRLLPLLLLVGSIAPAMAHPVQCHSQDLVSAGQAGFLHPLTGLDHLLVMIAVGLWAVQLGGRALWLLPCSFVGSMMIGGALGLTGIHQPLVEHGILASIILLGTALGMAWRPSQLIASLCVSAAGLCHGYAHGSEIPSGAIPILFIAGMMAGTALLHVLGLGGGLIIKHHRFQSAIRVSGFMLLAVAVYSLACGF